VKTLALLLALAWPIAASAQTLPNGFQESVVFSGLVEPTAVRFASDGRIFVAEKRGVIKVFDSLTDATPTVFADLNANVYNFWDRGLLGLALPPDFPTTPFVYVLYTYDFDPHQPTLKPRWGTPGVYNDPCPSPPGATADGCVVTGRLSRLQAAGNVMTGEEQVLIDDWCQQYPSHSIGGLAFGADGALYVSGGDGASFNFVDYGQDGTPLNPCGDPPGGVGGVQTSPTAEGGALRSQDLRTSGDPAGLNGAILRVDPATGAALPDNPLAGGPDANAARVIAYGLRNPFRFTIRPGTNDVWLGDVGWNTWEEIDRIPNPTGGLVTNFGWPCYEGVGRQSGYDAANLTICEALYAEANAVTAPVYTYNHSDKVVPGETCPTGSSSITGVAFYGGGAYPSAYTDALFFADYSRDCIWVMFAGTNGLPDPSQRATMVAGAANPVDLQIGPNGDLFYVDLTGGTIRRISFFAANQPPTAVMQATPTSGNAPLTVTFDGRGSSDPDPGDKLTYSWDLDGDGIFGDATTACCPTHTYVQPGSYTASLRVTDLNGASDVASTVITAANTPPAPAILTPSSTLTWRVGDAIAFSGRATDAQDGTLPASALSWALIVHHCPSTCHEHLIQSFVGVSSGSFTAPDHEYPSYLELRLTAVDSGGLQAVTNVLLQPQTVVLTFETTPVKLKLAVNSVSRKSTFTMTVIVGSRNTISAASPQALGANSYEFVSWSDGGGQTHDITAGAAPVTFTATYRKIPRR
jgi:glucose/arabinose dehydrogenase/PKD repeat protein